MRKLGIIIALTAAATLGLAGFAGPASAQDPTGVCNTITGNAQWQDANALPTAGPVISNTVQGASPANDPSEHGLQQSCADAHLAHVLCGAADGAEVTNAELANGIRELNAALTDITGHECGGTPPPPPPGGGGDDDGDDNGGGGGGVDPAVQAASAGADGGLPRTGGELFAGAGFAVMSLGALVRRFIR